MTPDEALAQITAHHFCAGLVIRADPGMGSGEDARRTAGVFCSEGMAAVVIQKKAADPKAGG